MNHLFFRILRISVELPNDVTETTPTITLVPEFNNLLHHLSGGEASTQNTQNKDLLVKIKTLLLLCNQQYKFRELNLISKD